jgi:hypothetical protein
MCWRVTADSKVDVGEFATKKDWQFINHQAATLLPDGRLLVVWSGLDGTPGEKVAASIHSGSGWSAPTIIAQGIRVRCLDVALDSSGRPNLIYVAPLDPPESYGRGLIVVDGYFPYKCWHTRFDGENWAGPRPIHGRGKFDIDKAILTLTPSGRLVLSVEKDEASSPGDHCLAVQVLGENGWSALTRLQE